MQSFDVSKEYREDLGEKDHEGFYDYAYRYFVIRFDFGDRSYWARIYTDSPDEADIHEDRNGVIRRDDERSRRDLDVMADYLVENEGVKRVTASTRMGYEPVPIRSKALPRPRAWLSFVRSLRR